MKCEICGKEFKHNSWTGDFEYCCSGECFSDKFWQLIINDIINDPHSHPIINGECYYIAKSGLHGYDGRLYTIKFNDDESIVTTNNLWNNGTIPQKFREQLHNNAIFINGRS